VHRPRISTATGGSNLSGNDEQAEPDLGITQHDGTFTNTALWLESRLGPNGERKAQNGVDAGDFRQRRRRGPGRHRTDQPGKLAFVNDGSGVFAEQSCVSASAPEPGPSRARHCVARLRQRGWLDLLAVNGEVNENVKDPARHGSVSVEGSAS